MNDGRQYPDACDTNFLDALCGSPESGAIKSPNLMELHAAIKTKRPGYSVIVPAVAASYMAGPERYRVEPTEDPEVFELAPILFDPSGRGMDGDLQFLEALDPVRRAELLYITKFRSSDERYRRVVLSVKGVSLEGDIAQGLLDDLVPPRKSLPYWYVPYSRPKSVKYEDSILAAFGIPES